MKEKHVLRLVGLLLDIFVVFSVWAVASFMFALFFQKFSNDNSYRFSYPLFGYLAYFVFFDITNNGQTIGKILVNIETKGKSTLKKRLVKSFLKVIDICIFPFVFLFYLITGEILHDYLLREVTFAETEK